MRIWLIHPKYLNYIELVHAWRSGLFAQKIYLENNIFDLSQNEHAVLEVFDLIKFHLRLDTTSLYLNSIYNESLLRNYNFDQSLINTPINTEIKINIYRSQVMEDYYDLTSKYHRNNDEYSLLLHSSDTVELNSLFQLNDSSIVKIHKKKIIL